MNFLKNNFLFMLILIPFIYGLFMASSCFLINRILSQKKQLKDSMGVSQLVLPLTQLLPSWLFFYMIGMIFQLCSKPEVLNIHPLLANRIDWKIPLWDEFIFFIFICSFILFHIKRYIFLIKNAKTHRFDIVICVNWLIINVLSFKLFPIAMYIIFIVCYLVIFLTKAVLKKINWLSPSGSEIN